MRIKFYTTRVLGILGLFGAGIFVSNEYNAPVYQAKEYNILFRELGRADVNSELHHFFRADVNGEVTAKDVLSVRRAMEKYDASAEKASADQIYWHSLGPNFVGGRTRGLIIDNQDPTKATLYAGAVAGGVWKTFNGGELWHDISGDLGNIMIGDIGQSANGTLFVGTGPGHDNVGAGKVTSAGFIGDGLFRRDVDGSGNATYTRLIGPSLAFSNGSKYSEINRVVGHPTDNNKIYFGGRGGFFVSENAQASESEFAVFQPIKVGNGIPSTATVDDIVVSNDGSTIYVVTSAPTGRIYKLNDAGGQNITEISNFTLPTGFGTLSRIALTMSPKDNEVLYAAAAGGNGSSCTYGMYQSKDGGDTWVNIGPGGASFDPYISSVCHGGYDNAIGIFPNDPGKIIVGGVSIWGFEESKTKPGTGGWGKVAIGFGAGGLLDSNVVHSDVHRIVIADSLTIYVASDGGIGKSIDGGKTWGQYNGGFYVTQPYSVAAAIGVDIDTLGPTLEQVMGGTQDNGTQYRGVDFFRPDNAFEIQGGDGFDCDFSNIANIAFSSTYNGAIQRAGRGGGGTFFSEELEDLCGGANGCGGFYTKFTYWEQPYATVTKDSLKLFIKNKTYAQGDTIDYFSDLGNISMRWPAPRALTDGDSVIMPDFGQTKLAMVIGSDIWMTKDAANLNKVEFRWYKIASANYKVPNGTSDIFRLEFSPDGNQLFLGGYDGNVYRIDNLNQGYNYKTLDTRSPSCVLTSTRIATIPGGSYISDIAVNHNNPEELVITKGGYGGSQAKVYTVSQASSCLTGGASVSSIGGDLPTGLPIYCAEISVSDKNQVIIGTEYGTYAIDNAFTPGPKNWIASWGMPKTAVYDMYQQTKKYLYDDHAPKIENVLYGKIYAGTHGRGFWTTGSFVGIEDKNPEKPSVSAKKNALSFKVYPNPMSQVGFVDVNLPQNDKVTIEVYDLSGKLVSSVHNGMMSAGKNKIQFDVNNLNNGTYIATMRIGDEMKVSKFVVMK